MSDTGTDPEPTGAERYLADRLRDPKYRAAYAAFRSQFPLPDTADDTGTDWAALADRLEMDAETRSPSGIGFYYDPGIRSGLRAAAVGLRRLAQLDTAIGDPEELRGWVDEYNGIMLRNFAAHILAAVLGSGEQPERTEP